MRATFTAVVGFSVLLSLPSKADSAFLLEIDSDDSWITQNCLSTCAPGPFSIAGRFELQVWDQDLGFGNIDLVDVSVSTEALAVPFAFPAMNASLEGVELTGDADPCQWPESGSGTCISAGRFDRFSGTFDGNSLQITGIDYQGLHNKPSYSYSIVASVVPEPSPAWLGVMALLALTSLRLYRSKLRGAK